MDSNSNNKRSGNSYDLPDINNKDISYFLDLLTFHSLQVNYLVDFYYKDENIIHLKEILLCLIKGLQENGKIIICGCGKSYNIAQKLVGTLRSLRIPTALLHSTEAKHGDLGVISEHDRLLFLSNTGETSETVSVVSYINEVLFPDDTRNLQCIKTIAVCATPNSTLMKLCDHQLLIPQIYKEQDIQKGLNAPTVSASSTLMVIDCLIICLSYTYYKGDKTKVQNDIFSKLHPNGGIGLTNAFDKTNGLKTKNNNATSEEEFRNIRSITTNMSDLEILDAILRSDWIEFKRTSHDNKYTEVTLPLPTAVVRLAYQSISHEHSVPLFEQLLSSCRRNFNEMLPEEN